MAKNDKVDIEVESTGGKVTEVKNPFVPEEKTSNKTGSVRFWSPISDYKIALQGKNVAFQNHVLLLDEGDPVVGIIRGMKSSDIKEVLNVPFKDEMAQSKFMKYLNELVYRGDRAMATRRGVIALQGLFERDEYSKLVTGGKTTADVLVMKAINTKSFKEGI